MTDEKDVFLTLIGPESVMRSLEKNTSIEGVSIGKPQPLDAMMDAADAPLAPDEIKMFMEFTTAALSLGVATLEFIKALQHGLSKADESKDARIIVLDGKTNLELVSITRDTLPEQAREAIEAARKK